MVVGAVRGGCRGVRRRVCSGRSVVLSMTWELRYPDLCL